MHSAHCEYSWTEKEASEPEAFQMQQITFA